jgi:hypothetical protein
MKPYIAGKAKFVCSKCGQAYSLEPDDFNFQTESTSQRNMGKEQLIASENEYQCNCGQEINIKFEVWEYPEGVINDTDHSADGASNIESEFEFIYPNEKTNSEDENNRVLGAATGGAILGGSLGGPVGAIVGGILGVLLGDSVNKSKKGGENG